MIKTRLVKLLSHAKKYIVFNVLIQWIALIAQVINIYFICEFLGKCLNDVNTVTDKDIAVLVTVVALVIVVRIVCDKLLSYVSYKASADVKRILRDKIYEKLLRLGASYKEKVSTAEVVQLSSEGVEQLETYFGKYLPQLFYSLLAPITLFIILCRINMKACVVLLICVPLIPMSIVLVQKIAKRLLNKYWGVYTQLGDSFLENLTGLTTLKIYQTDEEKSHEMDKESEHFRKITMKVLTMQLNSTSVMDIVAYGGAAVGIVFAVKEYLAGNVAFAGTLMIILLASEFFIPLRLLGSYFHIAMNGMAASDKIFKLLDIEEGSRGDKDLIVYGKSDKEKKAVSNSEAVDSVNIELSNVGFSYDGEKEILKDINLKFNSGDFISLVGESGSGKSTIASLIIGKNTASSGNIKINGLDISDISEESRMKNITLVGANSYLFKGTVEYNLRMAKPDASQKEMEEVLEKVNLKAFLDTQDGIKTELYERASNLSGGQAQRLSLARALLSDTPVYIFDEATSNIDSESEEMIMDVIRELKKTKTVLLISHRLSNVVDSDCIYMLDKGKISECGRHEDLLRADGAYAKLYNTQKSLENYGLDANGKAENQKVISAAFSKAAIKPDKAARSNASENASKESGKRRTGISIMLKLIVLVKPLAPVMLLAVTLGVIGYLCAMSITIFGTNIITADITASTQNTLCTILIIVAIMRGFLHYAEQYCNHFIAFKLLAIIRHKVFAALRRLCPAKLDGRDRGNLISIITSDIELLEVFYAHTISPICIAFITGIIMIIYLSQFSLLASLIAAIGYIMVGCIIPVINGKLIASPGMNFRNEFGDLNSFVLDSLRGLDETIQYNHGKERQREMNDRSVKLSALQKMLSLKEGNQGVFANLTIYLAGFATLIGLFFIFKSGSIPFSALVISTVTVMGTFGPMLALSRLSNNLTQTLASGERVLNLLEEEPEVAEITESDESFANSKDKEIRFNNVTFAYDDEIILDSYNMTFTPGEIIGLHGVSGSGKSTILKLIMRFYDPDRGNILIGNADISKVKTKELRDNISYVTQETHIFHDSIANNIAIGRLGAGREEIIEAAKKASIHEFIKSLPDGYDTKVSELGSSLSAGEKQRIGIARAFLHNAEIILMDEPTSNLDSLNEGIILKALREEAKDKTIIIVSHRDSTMKIADTVYEMDNVRNS